MNTGPFPTFAGFFADVHGGWEPFAWQAELAARIASQGWPDVIDVPTGLGKTAVLDLAVYTTARMLAEGRPDRARTRTFYVVDRRVIVDSAWEHARRIARALAEPRGPAAAAVADALRRRAGPGAPPLQVVRMRGGVTWEWRWLRQPDQPAIVVGTVDQYGSRLLFRGYGVGRRLRSIDAALTGSDALVVLDEAHLSEPLRQTLHSVRDYEATATAQPLPGRALRVVTMSATARQDGTVFRADIEAEDGNPEAERRLAPTKTARLVELGWLRRARKDHAAARADLAEALTALVRQRLRDDPAVRTLAVVANTVPVARAVFDALRSRDEAVLLVGRCRDVDRDLLLRRWLPRLEAGRARGHCEPIVVVATQTIEVGADLDFDALITEAAPLDALVQRFGRVARRGEPATSTSFVVHAAGLHDEDPYLYGDATRRTWQWLVDRGGAPPLRLARLPDPEGPLDDEGGAVDFGPREVSAWPESDRELLIAPPDPAPVVLGKTLAAWARTEPAPYPDQPVAPFLHGLTRGEPVVSLCWRAGLPESPQDWVTVLDCLPPGSPECVEVPLWQARAYLHGSGEGAPLTDQEGERAHRETVGNPRHEAVAYRGRGDARVLVETGDVRPGDLVVVRAGVPGHDEFGWGPAGRRPTVDVGDLASRRLRVLRLHPEILAPFGGDDAAVSSAVDRLRAAVVSEDPPPLSHLVDAVLVALRTSRAAGSSTYGESFSELVGALDRVPRWSAAGTVARRPGRDRGLVVHAEGTVLLVAGTGAGAFAPLSGSNDDDTEDGSSRIGHVVPLDQHLVAVGRRARDIAGRLGLAPTLQATLELAGQAHDLGKADERFQALLFQGDRLRAEAATTKIAKSGMPYHDRQANEEALRRSGWPVGMRHEAVSVALLERLLDAEPPDQPFDRDLCVHLVATHHGWARPLSKATVDTRPRPVAGRLPGGAVAVEVMSDARLVDWEGPTRFAALSRKYGHWGLALLESVLRLADMACSEEGT